MALRGPEFPPVMPPYIAPVPRTVLDTYLALSKGLLNE